MKPIGTKPENNGFGSRLSSSNVSGLHILTLFNLGVAYPLYSVLGQADHLPFFTAHRSSGLDIFGLIIVFSLLLPGALYASVWLTRLVAKRLAVSLYVVIVFLLLFAFSLAISAQFPGGQDARFIAIPLLTAVLVTLIYCFSATLRMVLTVLSMVIFIAPVVFLWSPAVQSVLSKPESMEAGTSPSPGNSPDVVMIIFDELPMISLIDEAGEIDGGRYPNFRRLADTSTWYRNTTTTYYSTSRAVTDMLVAGNHKNYLRNVHGDSPLSSSGPYDRTRFPSNLFSLLEEDHAVFAIEHDSPQLAINSDNPTEFVPVFNDRMRALLTDSLIIYGHIITPKQFLWHLPVIEGLWSGFLDAEAAPLDSTSWPYADSKEKLAGIKHVVESIKKRDAPTFYFLHAMLPHFPFVYNEQGQLHSNKFRFLAIEFRMAQGQNVWPDETTANLAYQAHLLQLGFTDTLLGKIIDRLAAHDLFDDALIIVTSDHGISFYWNRGDIPGETLSAVQASGAMFIPLFIKHPGQRKGIISDRDMQIVDIVPTMAEILNRTISWNVEGRSAFDESPPPKRTAWLGDRHAEAPGRAAIDIASQRKFELFGTRSRNGLYASGPHAAMIGMPVSSFQSTASTATAIIANMNEYQDVDPSSSRVPAYVEGQIQNFPQTGSSEMGLAIAVNGVIRQTAVTTKMAISKLTPNDIRDALEAETTSTEENNFPVDGHLHFLARIPPEAFTKGVNTVTVHGILEDDQGVPSSLIHFSQP
jgi:hypothetical protein